MASQSGTITSSQGRVVLSCSPNDYITITVASSGGTYSLEYPIGTSVASSVSATATYLLGANQLALTCSSGSVSYALTDVAEQTNLLQNITLTDAQFTALVSVSGLVSGVLYKVGTPETWYRAIGTGSYIRLGGYRSSDNSAYSVQFGAVQNLLTPRRILASATGLLWTGSCVLVGLECVENGSAGTFSLDDALAADSNNRISTGANTAATDGTQYPMVGANAGMLINTGLYFTNSTGGAWWVDIIDGNLQVAGVEQSGAMCAYSRVSASGIVLSGPAWIHSIRVVSPGSAGSLVIYSDTAATAGRELRITAGYAYSGLTANQLIPIGALCDRGLYLTMPTSGVVCVNYLPR